MRDERQRRVGWLARQFDHARKEARRLPEWVVHTVTTLPVRCTVEVPARKGKRR
jgi:hypothetical protein